MRAVLTSRVQFHPLLSLNTNTSCHVSDIFQDPKTVQHCEEYCNIACKSRTLYKVFFQLIFSKPTVPISFPKWMLQCFTYQRFQCPMTTTSFVPLRPQFTQHPLLLPRARIQVLPPIQIHQSENKWDSPNAYIVDKHPTTTKKRRKEYGTRNKKSRKWNEQSKKQ